MWVGVCVYIEVCRGGMARGVDIFLFINKLNETKGAEEIFFFFCVKGKELKNKEE